MIKTILYLFLLLLGAGSIAAQSKAELAVLAALPKIEKNFPVAYRIVLPRADLQYWDDDFNYYYRYIAPELRSTQQSLNFSADGVNTMMNANSLLPHAQLDTNTIVSNAGKLQGTWRILVQRKIRFTDSIDLQTGTVVRRDTLLHQREVDIAFAFITADQLKMYMKKPGGKKLKKETSGKYKVVNGRYLLMQKMLNRGVSQVGIDEDGYLIINSPAVIEDRKPGEYAINKAVIEQYIMERVK